MTHVCYPRRAWALLEAIVALSDGVTPKQCAWCGSKGKDVDHHSGCFYAALCAAAAAEDVKSKPNPKKGK